MNSCLYECTVMHHRLSPRNHRFHYRLFMFYLDLDEIPDIVRSHRLISHNRFNVFSFRDRDHYAIDGQSTKRSVQDNLRAHGVSEPVHRIMLLTHLATMGYAFNPVSFYFCFDAFNRPLAAVAEVGNTFGEKKMFVLGGDHWNGDGFYQRRSKFFYVSPFINMDAEFEFRLPPPDERLNIHINDFNGDNKFFLSTLTGRRRPLTDRALAHYALRFPLVTLRVIGLIHWEATKLYLKRLPFYRKHEYPELQREVYHG